MECLDSFEDELHRYTSLNLELDKKIAELGLDKETAEKYRKSINSDPIGVNINQSEKCLELIKSTKTDNLNAIFLYPLIGAIIGAIVGAIAVIYGTEKFQHRRILNNGKDSINTELARIKTILEQKVEYSNGNLTFQYAPYDLSTTAFDSVISSGTFLHFPIELQQKLVVLYFHIKEHNTLLHELTNIIIKTQTENVLPDTIQVLIRYYERIVINENRILERYLDRASDLL